MLSDVEQHFTLIMGLFFPMHMYMTYLEEFLELESKFFMIYSLAMLSPAFIVPFLEALGLWKMPVECVELFPLRAWLGFEGKAGLLYPIEHY